MGVLTRNGKALASGESVLCKMPPYWKQWNYLQAIAEGTKEIYEWYHKCFSEGFTVQTRTVEDGQGNSYTITVDGGDGSVVFDGVTYFEGFRRIVIPVVQFGLTDTTANRSLVSGTFPWRVIADDPLLLNTTLRPAYDTVNGKIKTVSFVAPTEEMRAAARTAISEGVAALKAAVRTHTAAKYGGSGLRPRDFNTEAKKRDVAKIIHDWLMDNVNYGRMDDYWGKTMYSAIALNSDSAPICSGWSYAFAYLCRLYGINAIYVEGTTRGGEHAWNYVSFELPIGTYTADASKWSAVDVTWDDTPDAKLYSATTRYVPSSDPSHPVYVFYQDNDPNFGDMHRYICNKESLGILPTNTEYWTVNTARTYGFWRYFCTGTVYNETGVTRTNNAKMTYPVTEPTAYYPYYGDTRFGIAEEDWIAPQGGGAV